MVKIREDDYVELEDVICTGQSASKLALSCIINGQRFWIPQSQIHDDSEVYKMCDRGTLVITFWLAKEKGLV